jgi:poly(3-hydroxybutyrate) depolymerase
MMKSITKFSTAGIFLTAITAGLGQPVTNQTPPSDLIPPRVVKQASDWAGASGASVSLSVSANGTPPISYQWRHDGVDLPGATNSILTLRSVQPTDAGGYTVAVSNVAGADTSRIAQLSVAGGWVFTNAHGVRLPYRLFLPPGYDPGTKYPLVLFWHGSSRCGTDNTNQLADYGQYSFLTASNLAKWPCFHLSPQWPSSMLPREGDLGLADCATNLLSYLETQYSIDPDRIYVTGLSMGAYTTWVMLARYPRLMAAAFPMAGEWIYYTGIRDYQQSLGVPVWNFHAANDGIVPVSGSDLAISALRAAGGSPIYTRYASGGHDYIYPDAYNTPGLVVWVMSQRRGVASTNEPLLSITRPTAQAVYRTAMTNLSLAGWAEALGQPISLISWVNTANQIKGSMAGTNAWTVASIPLVANRTNLLTVTATTASGSSTYGGNTTFNAALTVIQAPIHATLTLQTANAVIDWTGGGPPYRVQHATDLELGDWSDLSADATPPVSLPLPLAGRAGFYRIIGQ